jgi:class 3 adenylate cyclase
MYLRRPVCHSVQSLPQVFPPHIAKQLRDGKKVEPQQHDCVTIFFSDIVGFTDISRQLEPKQVMNMLDRLYDQVSTPIPYSAHHRMC